MTTSNTMSLSARLAAGMICTLLMAAAAPGAFAMGSSSPSPTDSSAAKPANPDFANAKAAIDKQDWADAITSLKKVTAAEPNNPEAFNLLGYATRKSGDPRGSIVYYQQALTIDPRHLGANEYIGEAYLMLDDVAKAEDHLKRLDELCTFGCKQYTALKQAIEQYKATHKPKSS